MQLASHLRMPLKECIATHTVREKNVWLAWLLKQWNNPNRHDWYLMQIAAEVRSVLGDPKEIKIEHFKMPFDFVQRDEEEKPKKKRVMTAQEATVASRTRWFKALGMLGGKFKKKGSRNGNPR